MGGCSRIFGVGKVNLGPPRRGKTILKALGRSFGGLGHSQEGKNGQDSPGKTPSEAGEEEEHPQESPEKKIEGIFLENYRELL